MNVPPLLVQTLGSLLAILALAGLAWWLKLGGSPTLARDDDVRRAAGEVEDGFDPVDIALNVEAALARDAQGRIMVIKRHGNRFAGRVLGPGARAAILPDPGIAMLEVDPGEPRFGKVFLALDDAQAWADAINRLNGPQDA